MYSFPGTYKNYDELEEFLTMEELSAMIDKAREIRYEDKKFAAALKGIDLEEGQRNEQFEAVQRRAMAKATGKHEEEIDLEDEFSFIDEDEEE